MKLMYQGGFLAKCPSDAWECVEDLAEKTMRWKIIRDDNLSSRYSRATNTVQVVSNFSHLESRFAALENMMKGLVLQ